MSTMHDEARTRRRGLWRLPAAALVALAATGVAAGGTGIATAGPGHVAGQAAERSAVRAEIDRATLTGAADKPARAADVVGASNTSVPASVPGEAADAAEGAVDAADEAVDEVTGERAPVRTTDVPGALDGADGRAAGLTAAVVDHPFTIAAAVWSPGSPAQPETIEIRVRVDGQWSDWQRLESSALDAVAPGADVGSDPLVAFGADGAQLRVSTPDGSPVEGLRLSLVDGGTASTDEAVASPEAVTGTQTASGERTAVLASSVMGPGMVRSPDEARRKILPDVITREQWGADESLASDSAQSPELKALVVHHTAGSNGYTREQAVQQMRGIYAYYTQTLGWGDFPYHLITDRFGNIYEGRRGALESNPVGSHAKGVNTGTAGISTMGNYDQVAPPQEVVDAMARAAAFYVYRDGLDATGKVSITSGGSGKIAAGQKLALDTIFPHMSTSLTACPGRYMVPKLDEIRTKAAAIAKAAGAGVSVSPDPEPAPVPVPEPVAEGAGTYTVRAGDGWWIISDRTGVSMAQLQRLNGMSASTVLHPGMVLQTTAAPAPVPAPAPAPSSGGTYTVRAGDGWWIISERTGVSATQLQRLNGMSASTMLHPGMVLKTGAATTAPAPSSGGTYTVRAGDGWWIISERTGVSMTQLQRLNGMGVSTMLHPGMVLKTG